MEIYMLTTEKVSTYFGVFANLNWGKWIPTNGSLTFKYILMAIAKFIAICILPTFTKRTVSVPTVSFVLAPECMIAPC